MPEQQSDRADGKPAHKSFSRKTALGRRLLLLLILAVLLVIALVWMSIYLFDPNGGIGLDDFGIFALHFNGLDTLLPRIL